MGNLPIPLPNQGRTGRQAPPPTGPKKPDIQPGPGRGQVAGAIWIWIFFEPSMKLT